jgi:hypothetical protein
MKQKGRTSAGKTRGAAKPNVKVGTPMSITNHKSGGKQSKSAIVRKRVASLKPSPENAQLYQPDDPEDITKLADSIRVKLHEPLVVTIDNFIVSGHRRHAALLLLGRVFVPCRVLPIRRDSMLKDEYVALLRDHNRQRNKSVADQIREEIVDINPEEAHHRLVEMRDKAARAPERNGVQKLQVQGTKRRFRISEDKREHVRHILRIVEEREEYWPLSIRGVHYPLLNIQFIRGYLPSANGTRQAIWYANDAQSYKKTSDLITRLRLNGDLPWEAFDDPTRPFKNHVAFSNVRQFIQQELNNLLAGYWRSLLQSQAHYIEVHVEKNTVYHMVRQVTNRYQIPTSSGRGHNSMGPWHSLAERYTDSGKDALFLIMLTDHDPEGLMMRHVAGRTLVELGIPKDKVNIIEAGVTPQQVERYGLHPQTFAKETSSCFEWYLRQTGGDSRTWEVEALDPADMLSELEEVLVSVLDMDRFNAEVAQEQEDAVELEATRRRVLEAVQGIGD